MVRYSKKVVFVSPFNKKRLENVYFFGKWYGKLLYVILNYVIIFTIVINKQAHV